MMANGPQNDLSYYIVFTIYCVFDFDEANLNFKSFLNLFFLEYFLIIDPFTDSVIFFRPVLVIFPSL